MRRAPGIATTVLLVVATVAGCGPATPSVPPTPFPSTSPVAVGPLATPVASPVAPSPGRLFPALPSPDLTPPPSPVPRAAGRPTRVVIATLHIDLAVVDPPPKSTFPLCGVAEYFKPPAFQHPGAGGVTYVYAHAREGMFLPILLASQRRNGKSMLGQEVIVWTARDHRFTYTITQVRRFQHSLSWAFRLGPNTLVLQTSETPFRDGTKVMLVARQVGSPVAATPRESHPRAHPVRCSG